MIWVTLVFLVLGLLWLPILVFFWRGWRERRNPISLAIVALTGFVAYCNVLVWAYQVDPTPMPMWIMQGTELAVLIYFYVSFRWAKSRFGGEYGPSKRTPKAKKEPPLGGSED